MYGCIDTEAFNYDSSANTDDGNCIAIVEGCTDSTKVNYNSLANVDNGSCNICTVNENGDILYGDLNRNGKINVLDIVLANKQIFSGVYDHCLDMNYNNLNDYGDVEKQLNIVSKCINCNHDDFGCTDSSATNYDSSAKLDISSCVY